MPCVACGAVEHRVILRARDFDRGETPFSLERCTGCGLVRTAPRPSGAELARWYAHDYYGGGTRKFARPVERLVRALQGGRARWLAKLARPDRGAGRVLDVGCGRGTLLTGFVELGWEAHGVERAEFDAAALPRGATIHRGDLEALPLDEASFDLVVFWHVLEHLPDPAAALRRASELLKNGGLLALAVPNHGSFQARRFGRHWLHLDLPRHLHHFELTTLRALVAEAHLKPCRTSTRAFEQDVFGFVQSFLNAVTPGRPNRLYSRLEGQRVDLGVVQPLLAVLASPIAVAEHLVAGALGRGATLTLLAKKEIAS